MDDKLINKLFLKVKNKILKSDNTNNTIFEYAFSEEEIKNINKENSEKIKELKKDLNKYKKEETHKNLKEVLSTLEKTTNDKATLKEEEQTIVKEEISKEEPPKKKPKKSFINLEDKYKQLIMDKWNEIDTKEIDKDIIEAKDLYNHNYTITYADDAARLIHKLRKKYEIVICYLIGFNNEQKEIYDKTIFSNHIDDEWKYLNKYIKILEKIRNFKK